MSASDACFQLEPLVDRELDELDVDAIVAKHEASKTVHSVYDASELGSASRCLGLWRPFPYQKQAFEFVESMPAAAQQQVRVFSQEAGTKGYRQFVVASKDIIWQRYMSMPDDKRHMYEIIRAGQPCHLYFDLEYDLAANALIDGDAQVQLLMCEIVALMKERLSVTVTPDKNIIELDSTTPKKFSRHLVLQLRRAWAHAGHVHAFVTLLLQRLAERRRLEQCGQLQTGNVQVPVGASYANFWVRKAKEVAVVNPDAQLDSAAACDDETAYSMAYKWLSECAAQGSHTLASHAVATVEGTVTREQSRTCTTSVHPPDEARQQLRESSAQTAVQPAADLPTPGNAADVAAVAHLQPQPAEIRHMEPTPGNAADVTMQALLEEFQDLPDDCYIPMPMPVPACPSVYSRKLDTCESANPHTSTSPSIGIEQNLDDNVRQGVNERIDRAQQGSRQDDGNTTTLEHSHDSPAHMAMADGGGPGDKECVLFIDTAVYTRNRAFRLYLSSKFGKGYQLKATRRWAPAAFLRESEHSMHSRSQQRQRHRNTVSHGAGQVSHQAHIRPTTPTVASDSNLKCKVNAPLQDSSNTVFAADKALRAAVQVPSKRPAAPAAAHPSKSVRPHKLASGPDLFSLLAAANTPSCTSRRHSPQDKSPANANGDNDRSPAAAESQQVQTAQHGQHGLSSSLATPIQDPASGVSPRQCDNVETPRLLFTKGEEALIAERVFWASMVTHTSHCEGVKPLTMFTETDVEYYQGVIKLDKDDDDDDDGNNHSHPAGAVDRKRQAQRHGNSEATRFMHKKGIGALHPGPTPWQPVNAFVQRVCEHFGSPQGCVSGWSLPTANPNTNPTLLLGIKGCKYCGNVQRQHKSNGIFLTVDVRQGLWVQRCLDPDCGEYRSPALPLPADVWQVLQQQAGVNGSSAPLPEGYVQ